MIADSNEKAKMVASLGLCYVERDDRGKVIGGISPALGGEMSCVNFSRHLTGIQIMSCRHHQFSGGNHICEAFNNGLVCYHAKAILIQIADENNYDVEFYNDKTEGAINLFVNMSKVVYMKVTARKTQSQRSVF